MNRIRVALVENHDLTREGIFRALWREPEIGIVKLTGDFWEMATSAIILP